MRAGVGLLLAALTLAGAPQESPVILGYYPSWVAHPNVNEINLERFTHLAHAFLQADEEGNLKESRAIPNKELTRRAHERGVKVLLSLGGARSAKTFRRIVRSDETRDRYVAAVAKAARDYGYDGIDLDWEPTEGEEDRQGGVGLARALKAAFPAAIFTMAVFASDWHGRAVDAEALKKDVDFLNVMTYDFHGPWSGHAGHNAPMHAAPDDEDGAVASVEAGMAYWSAKRKWPAERLLVGIPCYGRGFSVREWHQKPAGKARHESIDHHDVAGLIQDGWRRAWDAKVGVPTLLKEGLAELISYEDAESAALKGAWARKQGYRGLFFWNIEQDWRDGDHEVVRAAVAAFKGR
ncbi:MAG: glycoside hydrolase family 18 protein [Planctomycetes bacterium]|nr:glycoside hydrolase family 18 protein [Planctomycetota bacterium]